MSNRMSAGDMQVHILDLMSQQRYKSSERSQTLRAVSIETWHSLHISCCSLTSPYPSLHPLPTGLIFFFISVLSPKQLFSPLPPPHPAPPCLRLESHWALAATHRAAQIRGCNSRPFLCPCAVQLHNQICHPNLQGHVTLISRKAKWFNHVFSGLPQFGSPYLIHLMDTRRRYLRGTGKQRTFFLTSDFFYFFLPVRRRFSKRVPCDSPVLKTEGTMGGEREITIIV